MYSFEHPDSCAACPNMRRFKADLPGHSQASGFHTRSCSSYEPMEELRRKLSRNAGSLGWVCEKVAKRAPGPLRA